MLTDIPEKTKPSPAASRQVHLKTWDEVRDYFAIHLKPIAHGPKGQPIYSHIDIRKLNVQLPEDIGYLAHDAE